jgi:hypothetical protein
MDLKIVNIDDEEARNLYESDLVLIRPDQIVAWRHIVDSAVDPVDVLAHAVGGMPDSRPKSDKTPNDKAAPLLRSA